MTDAARAIPRDRPGGAASADHPPRPPPRGRRAVGEAEHDDVVGAHDDAGRLLHAGSAERRHRRPHECVGRRPHEQEAVTIGATCRSRRTRRDRPPLAVTTSPGASPPSGTTVAPSVDVRSARFAASSTTSPSPAHDVTATPSGPGVAMVAASRAAVDRHQQRAPGAVLADRPRGRCRRGRGTRPRATRRARRQRSFGTRSRRSPARAATPRWHRRDPPPPARRPRPPRHRPRRPPRPPGDRHRRPPPRAPTTRRWPSSRCDITTSPTGARRAGLRRRRRRRSPATRPDCRAARSHRGSRRDPRVPAGRRRRAHPRRRCRHRAASSSNAASRRRRRRRSGKVAIPSRSTPIVERDDGRPAAAWPGVAPDVAHHRRVELEVRRQRDRRRGGRRDATGLGYRDDDRATGHRQERRAVEERAGRAGRHAQAVDDLVPDTEHVRARRRCRQPHAALVVRRDGAAPTARDRNDAARVARAGGRSTPGRPATARRLRWRMTPRRSRRAGRRSAPRTGAAGVASNVAPASTERQTVDPVTTVTVALTPMPTASPPPGSSGAVQSRRSGASRPRGRRVW